MTAVVTFVHCFHCNAEQTVVGPSVPEYLGWKLDLLAFYTPGGRHQCPQHRRAVWQGYCSDLASLPDEDIVECERCLTTGGVYVDAPDAMAHDEVVQALNMGGIRCDGGREFFDVESVGGDFYFMVQPEVRIWL